MSEDSSREPKKFEIKDKERKKFQIQETDDGKKFHVKEKAYKRFVMGPHGDPIEKVRKRLFKIQSESNIDTPIRWFRQNNANDCGPCLLLNSLQFLEVTSPASSIADVRRRINDIRQIGRMQELPANSNITNFDMGQYFSQVGRLEVDEYPVFPASSEGILEEINSNLTQRPFDLIYATTDGHFRGIIPTEQPDRFLLLDSLLAGPTQIGKDEVKQFLEASTSIKTRVESVGIVRKSNNPEYKVHT